MNLYNKFWGDIMMIDTNAIFSMTQANQNFSKVAKTVDRRGDAVIFKNNKPKYLLMDIESNHLLFDLTEDERFDIITKRVLNKYLDAFKELAK